MERRIVLLKRVSAVLKWLTFLAPSLVILGWMVDNTTLKYLVIGSNAMNPLTALLFILLTSSLFARYAETPRQLRWLLVVYGIIFMISGISLMSNSISNFPVHIDHIFFGRITGDVDDGVNPMAPASAVLFMVISLANILRAFKWSTMSEPLLVLAFTLIVFFVTGYAFKVPEFHSSIRLFPALQTCFLFATAIFAILFSTPALGIVGLLVADLEGARVGRNLIILTVTIPVAIAYVRMLAQWHYLISTEMGVAIVMSGYILIFTTSLFVTVASLNKRDKLRKEDVYKINDLNEELKTNNSKQQELIEELATSNEELQATTENLRAANDELLATNEKLEEAMVTIKMQDEIIIHQKEEALRRSQEYLEIIFTNTEEEILLLDAQGKVLMFNQALSNFMERATGHRPKPGSFVWDMTLPERASRSKELFKQAQRGEVVMQEASMVIDGETIVHLLKYEPVRVNNEIKYVTVISLDITDQKEASEQLKERVDQLQKTNYELDRFVYSVSHDLRAPLSSILGLVNVAELEHDSTETPYLKMIKGRINTLDNFIKNILDYSRNSRTELQMHEIDFDMLIETAKDSLRMMNGFASLQINVEVEQEAPFYSDALRVATIFNNLFSNAIRFRDQHKPHSTLYVKILTTADQASIIVRDNGIGIASEHLPKVFNMFYRATDREVGSGIGLYLVKETVTKLNGTIILASELGLFTELEIMLPNRTHI